MKGLIKMARNVRTLGIKGFVVDYAVAHNGTLEQHQGTFNTASPRKLVKAIASAHSVDPAEVMVIKTTEFTNNYRILDVVKAVELLEANGLAVVAETAEPVEE